MSGKWIRRYDESVVSACASLRGCWRVGMYACLGIFVSQLSVCKWHPENAVACSSLRGYLGEMQALMTGRLAFDLLGKRNKNSNLTWVFTLRVSANSPDLCTKSAIESDGRVYNLLLPSYRLILWIHDLTFFSLLFILLLFFLGGWIRTYAIISVRVCFSKAISG